MENTIIEDSEPQTIPKPHDGIFKKANCQSYKRTVLPHNFRSKYKSRTHFTNILITISNKTISPNHNIPIAQHTMVHRGVQKHKTISSNPQEIQNLPPLENLIKYR